MKFVALALAVIFFVLTALYWTGHGPMTHGVHFKHGILALILGLLSLIWFRFLVGNEATLARRERLRSRR